MAKYKVGDKVRVRSDLRRYDDGQLIPKLYYMENDITESNTVVPVMLDLAGKIVTIKKVERQYKIDDSTLSWTDEMFEGLAEEVEFHVFDTVKHEKYGIGTVLETAELSSGKKILLVEFDEWNEEFPNFNENTIWVEFDTLTVIMAYSPN